MMQRLLVPLILAMFCAACTDTHVAEQVDSHQPAAESNATSLELLHPGVWIHTSFREAETFGRVLSNGLVVASEQEAILVNTAWGEDPDDSTEGVLREAARELGAPVHRAVLTHFHDDSVAGIGTLRRAGIPTHALDLTAHLMENEGWIRPDSLFGSASADVWTLRYGDREIELLYAGPGHTADNIVVYVPDARLLFGGCLIRPGESKSLGNTADADVEQWAESVARVRARYVGHIDIVVPTHGAPGGPELLDHTIRLVEAYRERPVGG